MADINSLIAQGVQFRAPPDPFAQYAQMQQLQQGATQNQLAQYQLGAAQRADVQSNALNQAYQSNMNADTGEINYPGVYRSLAGAGAGGSIPNVQQQQFKLSQEKAALAETLGKVAAQPVALAKAKTEAVDAALKQSRDLLDRIDPYSPDAGQQLLAWHQANHAPGILGDTLRANGSTTEQTQNDVAAAVNKGPQGIADFMARSKMGQQEFAKMIAPIPEQVKNGQKTFFVDKNPKSPTFGEKIGGAGFAMEMTPGEIASNKIAQSRLGISAIAADPYNISGVQAAFPVPGAAVSGTPSATAKQPSGAPVIQNAATAMKAGLTGEDLLTHLPTPLANQVRAIGEGREPSPAARSLTTAAGRQLMSMVSAAYPEYDAKNYATMGTAEKAFTSGKKGDTTRSFNVAVDHLGTLQQVSDALQNGDTRLFNQAGNFIALQTGQPAPTDFAAVKRIVADEVTKAVLGGAGALGDRKAVDDAISAANSPAQLKQVIDRYKQLMGGQLTGLEQQYTASTGKKDFRDKFLTPTTKAALGAGSTATPAVAAMFATNPQTGQRITSTDGGNTWAPAPAR